MAPINSNNVALPKVKSTSAASENLPEAGAAANESPGANALNAAFSDFDNGSSTTGTNYYNAYATPQTANSSFSILTNPASTVATTPILATQTPGSIPGEGTVNGIAIDPAYSGVQVSLAALTLDDKFQTNSDEINSIAGFRNKPGTGSVDSELSSAGVQPYTTDASGNKTPIVLERQQIRAILFAAQNAVKNGQADQNNLLSQRSLAAIGSEAVKQNDADGRIVTDPNVIAAVLAAQSGQIYTVAQNAATGTNGTGGSGGTYTGTNGGLGLPSLSDSDTQLSYAAYSKFQQTYDNGNVILPSEEDMDTVLSAYRVASQSGSADAATVQGLVAQSYHNTGMITPSVAETQAMLASIASVGGQQWTSTTPTQPSPWNPISPSPVSPTPWQPIGPIGIRPIANPSRPIEVAMAAKPLAASDGSASSSLSAGEGNSISSLVSNMRLEQAVQRELSSMKTEADSNREAFTKG